MRKRSGRRIFCSVFFFSMAFSAVYLAINRGRGLEIFIFDRGKNLFGDFINNLHYPTHEGGPWFDSVWATFPPLAYTFYWLFNVAFTRAVYPFELFAYAVITSFTCMLMIYAIQRIFHAYAKRQYEPSEPLILAICAMLSGIMIWTVERGNSVLNVMVMLLWAFFLRESKEGWKRELALLLIAVAANFKLYPALFGVIYLLEKRWKDSIRLIIYGVVLFVIPFAWFSGVDGFKQFLYNQLSIHSVLRNDYLTSIPSVAGYLAAWLGWNGETALKAGKILALVLGVVLAVCVVLDKRLWMRCMLITSFFILVPGWSAEYMAIYMLLPLVLFWCDGEKNRWQVLYMLLFGGIFVLLPFGVPFETPAPLSWNMLVSFISIYLITLVGIVDVMIARLTKYETETH